MHACRRLDAKNATIALVALACVVVPVVGRAQNRVDVDSAILRPRIAWAVRAGTPPRIDGRLDDSAWRLAPILTDFVQSRPEPGAAAVLRTETRVVFDDDALYVAVRAFDPHPESILAPYPRRDDETTSDWIFVEIDTRHDHRNAVSLGVNPRGVQVDGIWSDDVNYTSAWNAVWDAATTTDSLGWIVEYRIPFSQLALSARRDARGDSTMVFGLNIYRTAPSRGETSNWSPRLPTVVGVVSHFNELRGVVVPSHRSDLEVAPYVSTRAARSPARTGAYDSARLPRGTSLLGGADIKAHPTPDLNLVLAIHPDFGQVEADPSEVNLSSYETFFPEQRSFFVEGADLFAFNSSFGFGLPFHSRDVSLDAESPFYSRRIGRAPRGTTPSSSYVYDAPAFTELLGAAKLQGRAANGLSVGVLAATSRRETALVADAVDGERTIAVEPMTHFVVARASRAARGGASAVGAMLTAVDRTGMDSASSLGNQLVRRALTMGVDARHRFGNDRYELTGWAAATDLRGSAPAIRAVEQAPDHYLLRPDADHLAAYRRDTNATALQGEAAQVKLERVGGEHWRWTLTARGVSPGFETNDVGFQRSADWLMGVARLSYDQTSPQKIFRRWSIGIDQLGAGWSVGGERRAQVANVTAVADLLNEWGGIVALDYDGSALSTDALRGGPGLLLPPRASWSATLHSDTRRRTQFTVRASGFGERAPSSSGRTLGADLDARLADRVRVSVGPSVIRTDRAWQYVARTHDVSGSHDVVARLSQRTAAMTLRMDAAFSSRLTFQVFAQPLLGTAAYSDYGIVADARASDPAQRVVGLPAPPVGVGDPSFGTHDLLGNAVLRWEYRPGSTVFVVWSQQRNAIDGRTDFDLRRGARTLSSTPATNVLQVKWSYWWTP